MSQQALAQRAARGKLAGSAQRVQASADRVAKRDRNRQRILDAAAELFFERGYAGTTMDALCEHLGVTKPFVYYYFKDKSQILDTLTLESAKVTLSSLKPAAEAKQSAEQRLRFGLRQLLDNHIRLFKAGSLYHREQAFLSPKVRTQMRDMSRDFHRDLMKLLDDGVAAGILPKQNVHLTALAIGGILGYMYTWYQPKGTVAPEQVIEQFLVIMLRAAGQAHERASQPA
ncbi:MAG TPA: TetR/AcrR family transcriptional regulator [Steroidobacter sp.]|uniref:TetR/AcrR family transcriptional regulator n=1 Tax=Steroidobacter sp. TaxID=1978227 RepID=UPI002ED8E5A4